MSVDTFSRRASQLDTVLERGAAWHERLSWSRTQIAAHQQTLLRRLLAHAREHAPFHAERLAGVDPATFTLDRLTELPVMTKREMMRDFDRVVTDRRLTRTAVEAHLANADDELAHLHDAYVVMASGGSSGERGLFVYDDEGFTSYVLTLVRETLHTVRGFGVTGDAPVAGAIVAAGKTVHATAAAARLAGSAPSPVRMHLVPATLPFEEVIDRLNALQPLALIAYGSMLTRLAGARADGRLTIAPFSVSSTSEPFPPHARRQVEAAFGVPAGNTFGSTEGLVGLAPPGHDAIRFAEDTCIVELVDAAGRRVGPGETADRVYVTNLVNLAQPLIRYELTDRMTEVVGDHPDGHLRAIVEGRSDEALRWGDVAVHPLVVRSVLVSHPLVSEYQVRQQQWGLEIDVVVDRVDAPGLDDLDGLVAAQVVDALARAGLVGATVRVERVEAIDRDPHTGKVRRFVALD